MEELRAPLKTSSGMTTDAATSGSAVTPVCSEQRVTEVAERRLDDLEREVVRSRAPVALDQAASSASNATKTAFVSASDVA